MISHDTPEHVRWWLVVGVIMASLLIAPSGVAAQQATVATDGPATASTGETITVTVTLTNTKPSEENYIADVSLPDGWSVESHTDDGGTWNGGDISWLWQNIPANESVTPTITVTAPTETSASSATIETTAKSKNGTEDTANYTVDISSSGEDSGSEDGSSSGGGNNDSSGDSSGDNSDTTQDDTQTDEESVESDRSQVGSATVSGESNTQTVHKIEDSNPEQPGTTVDTSETRIIEQVSFNSDSIDGELKISAYENIPPEVNSEISGEINQDLSTTGDGNSDENSGDSQSEDNLETESTDTNPEQTNPRSASGISLLTLADISPPEDARDTDASITFTISSNKLDSPEQAVIVHKRESRWQRLQTDVVSTTNGSVTLEATTASFSMFALVEDTTNTVTTGQSSTNEGISDTLSVFHLTAFFFTLVSALLLKRYRF